MRETGLLGLVAAGTVELAGAMPAERRETGKLLG